MISEWNKDPRLFVWTKTADEISTPSPPTAAESATQDTSKAGPIVLTRDAPGRVWP
jgi:hypothetical protein